MAKISLSYPDTGLTISVSVKNRDTGTEDFSGTMTEVESTKVYKYDFTEIVNTDYVYTATVAGYSDLVGTIYRDGGGLTTEQDTALSQIDGRVDIKVSDSYGIRGGITQKEPNPDWLKKLIKEHDEDIKKEFNKAIEAIEKTDNKDIIQELEYIKKAIPKEKVDDKSIQKLEKIEKWIDKESDKEKKEEKKKKKEREEKEKREKEEQEQIMESIERIEKGIKEMQDIQEEIDKGEQNSILKLIENGN